MTAVLPSLSVQCGAICRSATSWAAASMSPASTASKNSTRGILRGTVLLLLLAISAGCASWSPDAPGTSGLVPNTHYAATCALGRPMSEPRRNQAHARSESVQWGGGNAGKDEIIVLDHCRE